ASWMSAAVTAPALPAWRTSTASSTSSSRRMTSAFRFWMTWWTSSTTPWIVWCSCTTPSIRNAQTAAPLRDDSSTRRTEFPSVWPKPRSRGSMTNWADRAGSAESSTSIRSGSTSPVRSISTMSSWWTMAAGPRDAGPGARFLLRVALDDELFLHRQRDVRPRRLPDHPAHAGLLVQGEPFDERRPRARGEAGLDREQILRLALHADLVARLHMDARHVHEPTVDLAMAVRHDLARLSPGLCAALAVHAA